MFCHKNPRGYLDEWSARFPPPPVGAVDGLSPPTTSSNPAVLRTDTLQPDQRHRPGDDPNDHSHSIAGETLGETRRNTLTLVAAAFCGTVGYQWATSEVVLVL